MGKVTLVRPDGSLISVDENQTGPLLNLGYSLETPTQEMGAAVSKGTEDYYSTPGQKVLTGVEGVLGGATLGLSDLAFDRLGFDTAERAGYNPKLRLGTELIGGLAGLGPLGELTPVGLLGKGAKTAAGALAEGKAARTAIQLGIEGGGFGGGAAITNSVINGDPLTAEAIMSGVGWGGVFGGGLGLFTGKLAARAESRAAAKLAAEEAATKVMRETEEAWGGLRSSVRDAAEQIKSVSAVTDDVGRLLKTGDPVTLRNASAAALAEAEGIKNGFLNDTILSETHQRWGDMGAKSQIPLNRSAAAKAFAAAKKAAEAGNYAGVQKALGAFKNYVGAIAEEVGVRAPEISGFATEAAKLSQATAKKLTGLMAAEKSLSSMAVSPEEFAKMSPGRAEKLFGSVNEFLSHPAAEWTGAQESIKSGISRMQEALGLKIEGPPAMQLRGVWEAMKHQGTVKAAEATASAMSGIAPWVRSAAGYAGGRAGANLVRKAGGRAIMQSAGYAAGRNLVHAIVGIKTAVLGGISKAVTEWAPRAAIKATPAMSRVEPLVTRIDGTIDSTRGKSREQLMADRAAEIRQAAGSVRDTMYKAVSGVAGEHPEFASAMHQLSITQFMFLMNKLPRDPGHAFNKLQSLWRPDPMQIEKFARYYEVFQNPVGAIQNALKTGRVTPELAEGLQNMYPAMYAQLRVDMMERISDPKVLAKMSYSDQISIGVLLHIPIHSTLTPQFVATQQQMYQERMQKLSISPQPGAGGNGGPKGPADVSGSTNAQRITDH